MPRDDDFLALNLADTYAAVFRNRFWHGARWPMPTCVTRRRRCAGSGRLGNRRAECARGADRLAGKGRVKANPQAGADLRVSAAAAGEAHADLAVRWERQQVPDGVAPIDEKSFLNDWQKAYLHFGMATIYLQMNWEVPIMDYVLKNMAVVVRSIWNRSLRTERQGVS